MNAGNLSYRSRRDLRRAEKHRRRAFEREIGTHLSAEDRLELEAILDRYDDTMTRELHDVLRRQVAESGRRSRRIWPTIGGY
jgi:hypothetical protein